MWTLKEKVQKSMAFLEVNLFLETLVKDLQ